MHGSELFSPLSHKVQYKAICIHAKYIIFVDLTISYIATLQLPLLHANCKTWLIAICMAVAGLVS